MTTGNHMRDAEARGDACTDAVSFRSNGDQPVRWTDAELREDAMRSVAAALRDLDTAAERLTDLIHRVGDDEADAIEGYARNIDEAREAIRAAKRWGLSC